MANVQQTPEETDLLGIFSRLEPSNRAALFAAAEAMLRSQDDSDRHQASGQHHRSPHGRRPN